MEFKKIARAAGLAAALAGGAACNPSNAHPEVTRSMTGNIEVPRPLSSFPEVIQHEFSSWQDRMNHLTVMEQAGVSIREIRPVHVPNQFSGLESDARLLRFEVVLSDGRSRQIDADLPQLGSMGESDRALGLFNALECVRPAVVAFAQERGARE